MRINLLEDIDREMLEILFDSLFENESFVKRYPKIKVLSHLLIKLDTKSPVFYEIDCDLKPEIDLDGIKIKIDFKDYLFNAGAYITSVENKFVVVEDSTQNILYVIAKTSIDLRKFLKLIMSRGIFKSHILSASASTEIADDLLAIPGLIDPVSVDRVIFGVGEST